METKDISSNSINMAEIVKTAAAQTSKMLDIQPQTSTQVSQMPLTTFSISRPRRGCACCCDPRGRMCMYGEDKGLINCGYSWSCFTKNFSRFVYIAVVAMAFVVCAAAAYSENADGSYDSDYIMPKNFIIIGGMAFIAAAIVDALSSLLSKSKFTDAAARYSSAYDQLVDAINGKLTENEALRKKLAQFHISETYKFPKDVLKRKSTLYENIAGVVGVVSLVGMLVSIAYVYINPLGSLLAIFVASSMMSWAASANKYIHHVNLQDKKYIFTKLNLLAAQLKCQPVFIGCENSMIAPGEYVSPSKVCDRLLL